MFYNWGRNVAVKATETEFRESDLENRPPSESKTALRPRFGAASVISWILGALSLLNLIKDLTPLRLYGLLAEWVKAYSLFAETISLYVFGWLKNLGYELTEREAHVLIVCTILVAAVVRASGRNDSAPMTPAQ